MKRNSKNIGQNEILLSHAAIKIREREHWSHIAGSGIPPIIADEVIQRLIRKNKKIEA